MSRTSLIGVYLARKCVSSSSAELVKIQCSGYYRSSHFRQICSKTYFERSTATADTMWRRHQHTDTPDRNEASNWLQAEFSIDSSTAKAVLRAFPRGTATVGELKAVEKTAMTAVVEAVKRDFERNPERADTIKVRMLIPHHSSQLDAEVPVGTSFFDLAKTNSDVGEYLECACSGNAACSTCHIIVDPAFMPLLPQPEEAELDMIDLAWGVEDTSRLGCQITFTQQLDGLTVTIPEKANNLY